MKIDILLKQLLSSLEDLKTDIAKFEKHSAPSTTYTQQLYNSIQTSNKFIAAYLVLKEQKDLSPDLDLHLKLMTVPEQEESLVTKEIADKVQITDALEFVLPTLPEVPMQSVEIIKVEEPIVVNVIPEVVAKETPLIAPEKIILNVPPLAININDKFRCINELFLGNANEYTLAIEQLNSLTSLPESLQFIKEIKAIYNWDDDLEMFKKLNSLVGKRF